MAKCSAVGAGGRSQVAALLLVLCLVASSVSALQSPYRHDRTKRDITSPPAPAPKESLCSSKQTSCRCDFDNGTYIDLSAIANSPGQPPRFEHVLSNTDLFFYYWNPCTPFTVGTPDTGDELNDCKDVAGCQKWYDFYSEIGYQEGSIWNQDHNGFYIYYSGGSDQYAPQGRELFVYLRCNPSTTTPVFIPTGDLSNNHVYIFEVTHSSLCLKKAVFEASGISPGTIMCIVSLVLIIAYLVGGTLFMKFVKKAEGKEIFPNITLWAEIPGLIKDGALFIRSLITRQDQSKAGFETI